MGIGSYLKKVARSVNAAFNYVDYEDAVRTQQINGCMAEIQIHVQTIEAIRQSSQGRTTTGTEDRSLVYSQFRIENLKQKIRELN